jgi:hypothetical protein
MEKDTSFMFAQALSEAKKAVLNYRETRDAYARSILSIEQMLKSIEQVIFVADMALENIRDVNCEQEILNDFVKIRDLFKEHAIVGKMKTDFDKQFLEQWDRLLHFAEH